MSEQSEAEEPTEDTTDDTADEDHDEQQNDDGTYTAEGARALREKNFRYRTRAKEAEARAETAEKLADELSRQLFTARVEKTGKLADPADLQYSADLLEDEDALSAAIDSLTEAKPHLRSRKPTGTVGQGVTGKEDAPFSLLNRLTQGV